MSTSAQDDDARRIATDEGLDLDRLRRWDGEDFASAFTEGRGTIDTTIVAFTVPAAVAAAMLPVGLQLAPQPFVAPDRHVMFASFARNHFSAWFGDMRYHELLLGIPFVELVEERSPHRGPFIYMPRILLDAEAPRILGERIYGFEKLPGRFTVGDDAWRVEDELGDLCVEAAFESVGLADAPDALDGFAWARKLLEMPSLSQAGRRFDREARITCDDRDFLAANVRYLLDGVDWDGVPVEATIEPVAARITFGNALVLPAGLSQTPMRISSLASSVVGAFRMRAKQVVSPPVSPETIRYPPSGGRKLRVAVLGGGPAGCAAAYHLARQTDAYDVTVYTLGWRLGGKCAAGRNPQRGDRIEEHGLHAFLGFYRNAIHTLGQVYADAQRPFATADGPVAGALLSQAKVGVLDTHRERWAYFPTPMGPNDGVPGLPPIDAVAPGATVVDALRRIVAKVADDIAAAASDDGAREPEPRAVGQLVDGIVETVSDSWSDGFTRVSAWFALQTNEALESFVETPPAASTPKRWVIATLAQVRATLEWYYTRRVDGDRRAWFYWGGLDTLLTIAIGLLEESTLDFDDLDDRDMIAWLLEHGLRPEHAEISTVTQVYETLFAHAPDDPIRVGDLACGVGLRWFLLVSFGYDGHPAYDFRWSCPETLMTPYYEALLRLGARVEFFHKTTGIEVREHQGERELVAVRMQVQATTKDGQPYAPLRPGSRRPGAPPAWPLQPHFDQLAQGEELQRRGIDLEDAYADWQGVGERVLRAGEDFDVCVLAIPLGALPTIVAPLSDPTSSVYDPRWRAMLESMSLVQTVSTQLWFDRSADEMFSQSDDAVEGDDVPRARGLLTGYVQPQGSLGEMSHLIAEEGWPEPGPKLLTFHTGALYGGLRATAPDAWSAKDPKQQREDWIAQVTAWFRDHHAALFDAGPRDFESFLAALHVPQGVHAVGVDRLRAQAFNIACQPSDLYVTSRPGETKYRLGQAGSGVRFLLLAGDWTKTDMNCGCVEAATQSGMLAARALSNEPRYLWRTGF
jgi:uncharacterized protein with NAD-binding domain and iron-sulfur cluster